MVQIFFFFPQTEMVIHVLVIKTLLYMHESIHLRKVLFLHPTSYNQSLPFVLLSIIHHVLTHSVSSRSLPLGLTRTSPSPSRLGPHPSILFLPLSSFIHLSIFLLHLERSPLFLLWVPLHLKMFPKFVQQLFSIVVHIWGKKSRLTWKKI